MICGDVAYRLFRVAPSGVKVDEAAVQPLIPSVFGFLCSISSAPRLPDEDEGPYDTLARLTFGRGIENISCESMRRADLTAKLAFLCFMSTCSQQTFLYYRENTKTDGTWGRISQFVENMLCRCSLLSADTVNGCLRLLYYDFKYIVDIQRVPIFALYPLRHNLCLPEYFRHITEALEKQPELARVVWRLIRVEPESKYEDALLERYLDCFAPQEYEKYRTAAALNFAVRCMGRKNFYLAHRIAGKYDCQVFYESLDIIKEDIATIEGDVYLMNLNRPGLWSNMDLRTLRRQWQFASERLKTTHRNHVAERALRATRSMGLWYRVKLSVALDELATFIHAGDLPDENVVYERAGIIAPCAESRAVLRAFAADASAGLAIVCTVLFSAGLPFPAVEVVVAHSHAAHLLWRGDELARRVGLCQKSYERIIATKHE